MKNTALLFSPEGGNVHSVTNKLGEILGNENVDIIPVRQVTKGDVEKYDQIILIGSTVGADHWSNESIEDEWHAFFLQMDDKSFEDKKTAIVGLGNSVLYPEHFADGMAHLHKYLSDRKAQIYGAVETDDYTFTDSEALNDDGLFCGLPIDEDNEDDLTTERLENWLAALKPAFEF